MGGLKIEAEVPGDWEVLRWIVNDATAGEVDLAARLAGRMPDEELARDWEAFVVPDLRAEFSDQVATVGRAIEEAVAANGGGPGALHVPPTDILGWFGALNQARLGLEERFCFEQDPRPNLVKMNSVRRSGFLRGRFYAAVQEIMLTHLM